MNKMVADMTIKPTGDVDRDFVAMIVPHDQGAIDMAQAGLRYSHEQLRRLAQEIVVSQQQEVAASRGRRGIAGLGCVVDASGR